MAISVRVVVLLIAVVACACGTGDDATSMRALVLNHEKLIAECMHRDGFEYIASVPTDLVVAEAAHAAVRQGRDVNAATSGARRQAQANPNDALVGKLSPAGQQAWGDALFGTDVVTGCYYETYREAWGVDLGDAAARGEQLLARVKADPAVRAVERGYVDCMATRGFRVTNTEEVFGQVARQREILGPAEGEALSRSANTAHDTCVGPYQEVFDQAYRRLSPK